jgi:hypothetical protein
MIIQHRDGSYELCPLPSLLVRWMRALRRQARATSAAWYQRVQVALIGVEAHQPCDGGIC